jgi:hypothetical protein
LGALIIGLVAFGIIISGVTAFAQTTLNDALGSSQAIREASETIGVSNRTRIAPVAVCETTLGSDVTFELENTGTESLHSPTDWDLIAVYVTSTGLQVTRLSYSNGTTAAAGEWIIADILAPSGASENVARGIVDPGERVQITARFATPIWASTSNTISTSTPSGATAEVDISGSNPCGFYLHNSTSTSTADTPGAIDLPATAFYPSQTTLYNYDTNEDAQPGNVIERGGSDENENNTARYQNWQTGALAAGLELQGTVSLNLWAAIANFNTTATGSLTAYLREYNGSSYTEIASTTITEAPWDAGAAGTWIDTTFSFNGLDYTIAQGNQLEIKVIATNAADQDMWIAYDIQSYPSKVQFPLVRDLYAHGEQIKVATSTYYELLELSHDTGYYLHNNPTPPSTSTAAQADLGITLTYPGTATLQDYDSDLDTEAGRTIAKGGSGADETDINQRQNWLSRELTADTLINGNAVVEIWGAAQGFSATSTGELKLFLRDYNGSTYTEVASTSITASAWDSAASGTWVRKAGEIAVSNYTVANGNQLELKITVGDGSSGGMMIAYDTSVYPSALRLPHTSVAKPNGNPTTVSADSGNTVDRVRPTENGGRLLFPLTGYASITDATWDVSYRVWTGDSGDSVADIHADMDVTIRTASGDVRATLGSEVAESSDIAASGWQTKTATFTPTHYDIVDQTDYLQIDLFADVNGNESNPTQLKFRLDDKTVSLTNWTHIENIGFLRN